MNMDEVGSVEVNRNEWTNERVSTGLEKLDTLLSGGLPRNSITLVSGTPGSGKSIVCYHYIWWGLQNNEKCLYLASDERINSVLKQASELGFDFQQYVDNGQLKLWYLDIDKPSMQREIASEVKNGGYTRVVLDSLTPVSELPVWVSDIHEVIPSESGEEFKKYPPGSTPATRLHVRRIFSILNQNHCTSLVTSEVPEGTRTLSRDTISEFLADGILLMDLDTTMDRRKITIRKMRATKHTLKPQDITITSGGIKFL